jgi:putative aldouronate transport system permease protein
LKHSKFKRELPLFAMLLAPVAITLVYSYLPMLGIVMAFQDYVANVHGFIYSLLHSRFVGLDIFKELFNSYDALEVVWNTFFMATMKIVLKLIGPLVLALLLNEVTRSWFKKLVTTVTYLPFFLSWVVMGTVLLRFFSPQDGAFNTIIVALGGQPTFFFGTASQFPYAVVLSDLWKEGGYNTIIFLAALTGVDLEQYEAAVLDGAGRWKQTLYVTLPSISAIIMLVSILSLGNILNAGFDQIFNLYSPAVYSTGDIIDTYAFRRGIKDGQFNVATAVGLFKSAVSFVMISLSYWLAKRFSNYRIF